jgi:hypothetical protein
LIPLMKKKKKYTDFLAKEEKERYEKFNQNRRSTRINMKGFDLISALSKSMRFRMGGSGTRDQ